MLLKFTKMQGLGNDFMVVNAVTQKVFFSKELIKKLSDRHFGVGFDQLLVVEPPYDPEADFHYRIFNADGSEVQMCGNGARCFAKFVLDHGLICKKEINVTTVSGKLKLKINDDGTVTVNMGTPKFSPEALPFKASAEQKSYVLQLKDGSTVEGGAVSMGNPHFVTFWNDVNQAPVEILGPQLENHEDFPERVNVGFAQVLDTHSMKLRVFERGCGETLACGSGACAAVCAAIRQGRVASPVTVLLKGGKLKLSWDGSSGPVMMTGDAVRVFEGSIIV